MIKSILDPGACIDADRDIGEGRMMQLSITECLLNSDSLCRERQWSSDRMIQSTATFSFRSKRTRSSSGVSKVKSK